MEQIITEFSKYVDFLVLANDVDPDYPVMKAYAIDQKLDIENEIFLSFWFSIVDNSTLAIDFFERIGGWPVKKNAIDKFAAWWSDNFKMFHYGKERKRNVSNTITHLSKYVAAFPDQSQVKVFWDLMSYNNKPTKNYNLLSEFLGQIPYFGTLTKYDFMELLQRSCCFPILPPELSTVEAGCYGPMRATEVILSKVQDKYKGTISRIDKHGEHIVYNLLEKTRLDHKKKKEFQRLLGIQALAIQERVEVVRGYADTSLVESCLCKFQKYLESRYYVGWEIDEALGEVYDYAAKNTDFDKKRAFRLREMAFFPAFLKEQRYGNDEELMCSYLKFKPHHMTIHFKEVADGLFDDILFSGEDVLTKCKSMTPVRAYFAGVNYLSPGERLPGWMCPGTYLTTSHMKK